jgi:hypothetical protein
MKASILVTLVLALPPGWDAALEQIIDGTVPCSGLRVHYSDGNSVHGSTSISTQGSYVRVVRKLAAAGEVKTYKGHIRRRGCVRLARQLQRFRFTKRRFKRLPLRKDETRPRIVVRLGVLPRINVQHRGFDVQNDPGFAVLRGELLRIAAAVSGGEVVW